MHSDRITTSCAQESGSDAPAGASVGMTHSAFSPSTVPIEVHTSKFRGASGISEYEFVLRPLRKGPIEQQLAWLENAYQEVLDAHALSETSGVFRRFFCTDPQNQAEAFGNHAFSDPLAQGSRCAISWVGQAPAPPAKVVLWAQHIHDPAGLELKKSGTSLALTRGPLTHHWTTNVSCTKRHSALDQTNGIFEEYEKYLDKHSMSLTNNVLRTWFFVRHVDVNYKGFVVARRKLFEERGLTSNTHFIASTGIEGISALDRAKVSMDAYAVAGIRPEQVAYLEALDHLGPTHLYGVTFERATAVSYSDRKHIYVSGTASIDPEGKIRHNGDIELQLDRALENVNALLLQRGAGLRDMASYIAYVRDPSDLETVCERFQAQLGDMPVAVVVAPVCRPGWLVELEGRALLAADSPELPPF